MWEEYRVRDRFLSGRNLQAQGGITTYKYVVWADCHCLLYFVRVKIPPLGFLSYLGRFSIKRHFLKTLFYTFISILIWTATFRSIFRSLNSGLHVALNRYISVISATLLATLIEHLGFLKTISLSCTNSWTDSYKLPLSKSFNASTDLYAAHRYNVSAARALYSPSFSSRPHGL